VNAFDLSKVTAPTEARISGHPLMIRPGTTKAGRYWQLLTLDGVPVGMVAEHWVRALGRIHQVYEASVSTSDRTSQAVSAMAAAQFVARSLEARR
jgi:hypothetical protein